MLLSIYLPHQTVPRERSHSATRFLGAHAYRQNSCVGARLSCAVIVECCNIGGAPSGALLIPNLEEFTLWDVFCRGIGLLVPRD